MQNLIVVNNAKEWPVEIGDSEVAPARAYLTDGRFSSLKNTRVFNLCRSYKYQSIGYYVSLLAAARGQKPMPNVATIQDLKNVSLVRFVSDDLDELIQRSMKQLLSDKFTLSIYFGKNVAKRYDSLSTRLFKLFPAPFLRAQFHYSNKWHMTSIQPASVGEIPPEHFEFAMQMTKDYFAGKRVSHPKRFVSRYDMAILFDPNEADGPSDEKAINRFIKAAESLEIGTEIISKDDYGRLPEFDALFIRESTNVNHHTFRFARKALAEGLVVIDDPDSILKCTNKVFLAELLARHGVPTPRTLVVHQKNRGEVIGELGLPCILKQPDSFFSRGVMKADNASEVQKALDLLLDKSDLVIAQEFVPTPFDWRIAVIDRVPLFACKYFMARRHWQIAKRERGRVLFGKVETLPLDQVPKNVLQTALKAANLVGNGLYGVDLKEIKGKALIVEINDNPTVESGLEDAVLKDELYERIMKVFLQRIEQRKGKNGDK